MKTCAVTGHRPSKLPIGSEDSAAGIRLRQMIRRQLERLYGQGVRRFYLGGALGVDLWTTEILLSMKEQEGYTDLEIILALPFEGHDSHWGRQDQKRMARLRAASDQVVIVCDNGKDSPACYRARNCYMVDHADCLLAVYDEGSVRSGTGMTVRYGIKKGIPVFVVRPKDCC